MAEGRCALSSYVTGRSPNLCGVCSPAEAVSYTERDGALTVRLGGFAIDRFAPEERAGYPTLCKARLLCEGESLHLFEDPVSLNAIDLLPDFRAIGVSEVAYYRWRQEFGGLKTDQVKRLKDLELTLDKLILTEAAKGNF